MLVEAHKKFGRVTRCPFNIFNPFSKVLVSYKVCCECLVPRGRQEATLLCCVWSRTGGHLGTHAGAMRPIWGRVECSVGFNWSKWGRGDCPAGLGLGQYLRYLHHLKVPGLQGSHLVLIWTSWTPLDIQLIPRLVSWRLCGSQGGHQSCSGHNTVKLLPVALLAPDTHGTLYRRLGL